MAEQDASQVTGGVATEVAAPDINALALGSEEMPSLADMAHEPSTGAWPDGWYAATILEGYATNSGHEFITEDSPSKDGSSRNMRICIRAKNKAGEERNYFTSLNYRKGDLTKVTMEAVKKALQTAKEQKWANKDWPAEWKDIHRTIIAIQGLAQFERALGFKLSKTEEGTIKVAPFFNQKLDARLRLNDETGYSDVAEFAKFEERKKLYK
jgi:hypothetical protein